MRWTVFMNITTVFISLILIFEPVESRQSSKYSEGELKQLFNQTSLSRKAPAISVWAKKAGGGRKPIKIVTDSPKTISEHKTDDLSSEISNPVTTSKDNRSDEYDYSEDKSDSDEEIQNYCAKGYFLKGRRCVPYRCPKDRIRDKVTWACESTSRSPLYGQHYAQPYVYRSIQYRNQRPGKQYTGGLRNGGVKNLG